MAMSIEEEITIYQFGHGVYSVNDMLAHVSQLNEHAKRVRLYELYSLIQQSNPVDADIDQAIADSSLNPTDTPCTSLKARRFRHRTVFLPDGESDKLAELLLYVFKIAYQRSYELEKENLSKWWYSDFSKPESVQTILARHQELIDEIYTNPSYRCEFVSLAKLWYKRRTGSQAESSEPEPAPKAQTHVEFLTYDEIITEPVAVYNNRVLWVLQNSVNKGLAKQYGLNSDQANRLVMAVIDRYMQETYNIGLL
jgi:hypothetical protein